jgi:hypothetical protein
MVLPWALLVVDMKAEVRFGASCCWSMETESWVTLPLLVALDSPDTADCIGPTPVTAWKATSPPLMMAVAMIGIEITM